MKLEEKELVLPPKRVNERHVDVLCATLNRLRTCPGSGDVGNWWAEDHGLGGWVLCERRRLGGSAIVMRASKPREIWYFLTGVRVALEQVK